MLSRSGIPGQSSDRVALKDEHLVYKACSLAFAQSVGRLSPEDVIGKTDFDLFPGDVAREQMALDSQAIFSAQADISALNLGSTDASVEPYQVMIVRTPVVNTDNHVKGIDIRLLAGPAVHTLRSAVTIDYQTLVNDGIQGSLIFSGDSVLFANDNASRVLGYPSAQAMMEGGRVSDLFSDEQLASIEQLDDSDVAEDYSHPIKRVNLQARSKTGSLIRLISRVTRVQWGAAQATLVSFVDVALIECATGDSQSPSATAAMADAQQSELRKIRANELRFRHYASSAADFFWEMDAQLIFRVVSEAMAQVLGIPRDHIVGRTHAQLLAHPANVNEEAHFVEHLQQLQDRCAFRDFEFKWSLDGDTRVVRYSGIPVFNKSREFVGYRGVGCDVTASVRQAESMAYHANHDSLTGLVNRRSFENTVHEALEGSRTSRDAHALCYLDLDSFKIVNDTCGHQAGDELLRQLTQLFDSLVRKSDVLARLGGDEFGILLYQCSVAEALKLANQIRHEVENFQFLWKENHFSIGVSVGLVVVDDRWESIESLFSAADSACYIAKNEGRNRVVVYREGEGNASNRKIATHWVEEINTALEGNRLRLACQKILPLHEQPDGLRYEMLLRLELPDGELVSPKSFLPSAERYGLVAALDERAVELTLDWLTSNPSMQSYIRHVSLNLSAGSVVSLEFRERLLQAIEDSGVDASKLCFEITESAAIANLTKVSSFMNELATHGCRFSIDDFGTGLSSFSYLRKLPVEFLKIDGLLVKDILDDPTDYTLVKAISDISKSMGKRTVAEYIESPRLLNAVRDIGIDFAQGFHLGEPELIS